ncbi:hypothetical protein ATO6_21685 [Oceanicola sp. 22II-s10i]|uniref:DUF6314 family protein n=1 Tax=Oceanicola sp. 22II-s10i TaxID=1317116 RepID=UPI000B527A9E|nr:DUF6314 family protein [Oceanicola sp. 22II-s10i]OWU82911.1 hypothetical protein ATO6_21685 [Oceanicola sp. 22II-s10i]
MPQLAEFEGAWRLERRVRHGDGTEAMFTGIARFSADGDGLMLHEAGEMRIAGQGAFRAERSYRWSVAGGRIAVWFDDGRFFHAFDPLATHPEAGHDCAPDRYDVAYDFSDWPRWRAVWRVRGPRKDYELSSQYSREADDLDPMA